jgi:phage pi2 protein 07
MDPKDNLIIKKQIKELNEDLALHKLMLKNISQIIIEEEVSNYPIFVAHREDELDLGKQLIYRSDNENNWNINVSHLEEFVNKNIINEAMVDNFKEVYKDPEKHMCLFVIDKDAVNFMFKSYEKNSDIEL